MVHFLMYHKCLSISQSFPVQCTLQHFACMIFTCGVVTLSICETAPGGCVEVHFYLQRMYFTDEQKVCANSLIQTHRQT